MASMTAILGNTGHNLLCQLFAEYKGAQPNTHTLSALRAELGEEEYKRFEADISHKLKNKPAWQAVADIIGEAIDRKKAIKVAITMQIKGGRVGKDCRTN